MNWIIPIGGKGTRTQALGEYKPLIKINGKFILTWFLISVKNNISPEDKFYFLTNEYYLRKYNLDKEIRKIFISLGLSNEIGILAPVQEFPGVSGALYSVPEVLDNKAPVIVINPDQYTDFDLPTQFHLRTGFLTIYAEFSNKTGYVEIKGGKVLSFSEKNNISNLASAGVFIVSEGRLLLKAIKEQIDDRLKINDEYYLGTAFNYLIRAGVRIYPLPVRSKYDLGNIPCIYSFAKAPFVQSL